MKTMTFEQWMVAVNDKVGAILFGMTTDDLPDVCYSDWFEDGDTPVQAARRAIRNVNE